MKNTSVVAQVHRQIAKNMKISDRHSELRTELDWPNVSYINQESIGVDKTDILDEVFHRR